MLRRVVLRLAVLAAAAAAGAAVAVTVARNASADPLRPSPPPERAAAPVLVAPKVRVRVEPVYPPERLKAGERGIVVLKLKIDATGHVADASVTTSAGSDFDAAALDAAKQLEFEPATKDGAPIAAILPWKFSFDFQEVAPATPPPPPPADGSSAPEPATARPVVSLAGSVRTPLEEGLPGATVTLSRPGGPTLTLTTDGNGRFEAFDVPAGTYALRIAAEGFEPLDVEEVVTGRAPTLIVYRPTLKGDASEIVVRGERPAREVTRRVLEQREISRIPGTNGDAIRSVQSLPGVARPPGLAGFVIVRGSAPQDTEFYVDGTLIPLIFHFGGLSSAIPTELVERLDFLPGNFSPEYGRVMGGILDVGVRSPRKEGFSGLVQVDLLDARALFEGALDEKTRFAIAGRRSWVDLWLGPVLRASGTGVSTAPVYYDYQLMVERDLTAQTTGRLLFFGSDDRLSITLNAPTSSDPAIGGGLSAHTAFYRLQARTETRFSPSLKWTNTFAVGRDVVDFALGDLLFTLDTFPVTWRSDVRAKVSKEASVIVGMDWLWSHYDVTAKFPAAPGPDEDPGPFFARPVQVTHGAGRLYRPAVYGMLDLSPVKALKIIPGVRIDYAKDTQTWTIAPRLAVRFDLYAGYPRTTLKGGAGVFLQPPQPQESIAPFGNAGLSSNRATHFDLGFEQELTRQLEVSVDGFYKDLSNLVVQHADASAQSGTTYANTGSGRAYGAEVLVRWKPDALFFGWLAYTLSRSERRDVSGGPLYTFDFDQTHILTALGSFQLGRGWEVGGRFRYVTGTPYTPNLGGVVDYDAGAYAPLQSSPYNTARVPSFQQLDLRIDKKWVFSGWSLRAYLDVQNVYNRKNPEGASYNYNYSQRGIISGLPIVPVLGLRGEL